MANVTEIIKFFDMPIGRFSDRSARWLLQDREYVRGLFEILAYRLVPLIDFRRLELINTSFLADDLRERFADIVFKVPLRGESGPKELFIYILIEHQSTVDVKMALRVNSYMNHILDLQSREWESNDVPASQQRLRPIIPIVFYTGEQGWNAPLTLDAIMDIPDVLSEFVPQFKILLLDVKGTDDAILTQSGHPLGWLLTVLKKENASEAEIRGALIEALSQINTLGEAQRQQWEKAISYLLLLILHRRPVDQHEDLKAVVQDQIPLSRRKDVTDMVYTMADRLIKQGEKRGIERGREEGIERGREEGIERGIERGTEQTLTTIAISMLNDNQPIDAIAKYTGLSEEAIEQLTESVSSST